MITFGNINYIYKIEEISFTIVKLIFLRFMNQGIYIAVKLFSAIYIGVKYTFTDKTKINNAPGGN